MSFLVLVVDDESDVEDLFRQQFRRDLRAGRFTMDFAQSGDGALQCISDAAGASLILILSDINMPGMSGLELLPKAKAARPDVAVIMMTRYGDADISRSTSSSVSSLGRGWRQLRRMMQLRSSFQSWITLFRMMASAPDGID